MKFFDRSQPYAFCPKDSGRNQATEKFTDRHLANENATLCFWLNLTWAPMLLLDYLLLVPIKAIIVNFMCISIIKFS